MPRIEVQTPELAVASAALTRLGADLGDARNAVSAAQGQVGAFGDEPIAGAFGAMCGAATSAITEYEQTMSSLALNVANAAVGYVTTDEGVIPVKTLGPEGDNP